MGLPNLFAIPDGQGAWEEFWFNHYQDHIEIVQPYINYTIEGKLDQILNNSNAYF